MGVTLLVRASQEACPAIVEQNVAAVPRTRARFYILALLTIER
jgi:hypothetical protein